MLTTGQKGYLDFDVQDSTVTIFPGTVRLGNKILPWRGAEIQVSNLADFSSGNGYQSSALCLAEVGTLADWTCIISDTTSAVVGIENPVLPTDGTANYSSLHALGLFTLQIDGTNASLVSYSKIV